MWCEFGCRLYKDKINNVSFLLTRASPFACGVSSGVPFDGILNFNSMIADPGPDLVHFGRTDLVHFGTYLIFGG